MRAPGDFAPLSFAAIPGAGADDLDAALSVFRRSAARLLGGEDAQRPACAPSPALIAAARAALTDPVPGSEFFSRWFTPFRLPHKGFVTAYYEPEVDARLAPEPGFETAALSRPPDLVTLNAAPLVAPTGETLTSGRRLPDGRLAPYPTRREIEEAEAKEDEAMARLHPVERATRASRSGAPIAYVRDPVELFLIQVQGSARLRLPDGRRLALTYDGRNGWPYTSVGRLIIERGLAPAAEMSLERLKATLREMGVGRDQPGRRLMQENRSYVFFRLDDSDDRRLGPIGGEGVPLTPLRSIAVDRSLWSYGLPFWISARIPWEGEAETGFQRLMIVQDTGSAILGAARADLFFGAGDRAGALAGRVRHDADVVVLLPREAPAP
ncbi:MltA domain-containing protein [Methylocystis echinoides]|uniref:murein transglycosylase A n=1 Tax=Methylocystis echinoides TaxID=29468 RepID=UPI00343BD24D